MLADCIIHVNLTMQKGRYWFFRVKDSQQEYLDRDNCKLIIFLIITTMCIVLGKYSRGRRRRRTKSKWGELTVDSNGDALREDKAVGTDESGDLSEGVELQVLRGDIAGSSWDKLDIKAVLLCDDEERVCSGVAL